MLPEGTHVALTGGAGGIGGLVAKELLAAGARLTIVDRVEGVSFPATYIKGDLSTAGGMCEIGEALAGDECDVLINLAGIQHFGPFENQAPGHIQATYMIDLVAPAILSQAVLSGMKHRGRGHIVNIGSVFGAINFAHFVTYSSAKAGLQGFSEALRREVAGTGIDVTYIAPRAVKTPLNGTDVLRFADLTKMNMDEPEDVAKRIVRAISKREKEVYIGFPENLFVRVNALMPRVVDAALAKDDRKTRALFNS